MTGGTVTARRPGWAVRIEAATPPHRDRTVDALRAVAIAGVVLGHWLVSALVGDPHQPGALHGASPLAHAPWLDPVSWFFQTLGPFFFAGGYAAARGALRREGATEPASGAGEHPRSENRRPLSWLGSRLVRLIRPVLVLAAVWLTALLLLRAAGVPAGTRRAVWSLVSHPLWFLLVYLALTALTPVLRAVIVRAGLWSVGPPVVLVALTDAVRPHGLPTWLALLAVPVGWSVPYLLGLACGQGRLRRATGAVLLPLGVAAGAGLVLLAGYPASAVGVPGDGWSNLDPPSLFALALAAAQLGAFLLVRPWLARVLRRAVLWAPVAAVNRAAMTVYCWHQSALLLVTFAGLPFGAPPGLLDPPTGDWPWHRLAWLPVFAAALTCLCLVFHRFEARAARRSVTVRPARPTVRAGGSAQ
ncbi:acyltransferase [Rugosimonospora acidiphila]|uniref:Acyltransferase n=1 Tax=Rugosimonospora acidiphila TaxID=556531 RepID=A0ABP9S4X5_9ACTN